MHNNTHTHYLVQWKNSPCRSCPFANVQMEATSSSSVIPNRSTDCILNEELLCILTTMKQYIYLKHISTCKCLHKKNPYRLATGGRMLAIRRGGLLFVVNLIKLTPVDKQLLLRHPHDTVSIRFQAPQQYRISIY